MQNAKRWLLPAGIEESLPPLAWRVEQLRRRILDLFVSWGYDLVIPPLIEYVESLLITGDEYLNLQTSKLVDQLNGRLMGVRADITSQAARIDAHMLQGRLINRLCYTGETLTTRPGNFRGTRSPLQFGAEIYGDTGYEGDIEIIRLMLETLTVIGVENVYIDLGHVGIFSALSTAAGFDKEQENYFSGLLNKKAAHEVQEYLEAQDVSGKFKEQLMALLELHGKPEVLKQADALLGDIAGVRAALEELSAISLRLSSLEIKPYYDLAELRGYHYKTGVVFAAFVPGIGQEVMRGGRYDNLGKVFGRARPAVGFSGDLHLLTRISADGKKHADDRDTGKRSIFAPSIPAEEDEAGLEAVIAELRQSGNRVVRSLHRDATPEEANCTCVLISEAGEWLVKEL